uniref:Transmembrane protein n=1 Tax=Solanum lycopersicum TaxID=4081 RepID=A0A3Q7G9J8_SOLLC
MAFKVSSVAFNFIACVVFLASVVIAHEGHDHHAPAPAPSPSQSSGAIITSLPSMVVGFFSLVISFLVIKERV